LSVLRNKKPASAGFFLVGALTSQDTCKRALARDYGVPVTLEDGRLHASPASALLPSSH
jgi:hypothetical protein